MADLQETARAFMRAALEKTGWSPYRLAKAAGLASTTITRPLNSDAYTFIPKVETMAKIAFAAGLELPDVFAGMSSATLDIQRTKESIPVIGTVKAGSWETLPTTPSAVEHLPMQVTEYAGVSLVAFRVDGPSADMIYPDGSYVITAPPEDAGVRLGDRVVVRRVNQSGLCETSVKAVGHSTAGRMVLEPHSSDPDHQDAIIYGTSADADRSATIIGVVIAAYQKERRGSGPLLRV